MNYRSAHQRLLCPPDDWEEEAVGDGACSRLTRRGREREDAASQAGQEAGRRALAPAKMKGERIPFVVASDA